MIHNADRLLLAKRFNFMIFEDDAYYYLDYGEDKGAHAMTSYMALESSVVHETGRVLRFDSMSKVLGPGLRLGFVTGSPTVLQMIAMLTAHMK